MRKIAAACLVLLTLATVAGASQAGTDAQDDGCLVVAAGRGIVLLQAKGFLLGRFDSGQIDIEDPLQNDGSYRVFGVGLKRRSLTDTRTRFIGDFVRFRASGLFRVRIEALGVDFSLAGKGSATLSSDGLLDPGHYSTDAQSFCETRFQAIPDVPRKVVISGQTAS